MSCYKIKYSQDEAVKELKKAKKARRKLLGHTARQEKRFYLCKDCQAYHLTSISQNEWELMRKKKGGSKLTP